ncbi:MAG: cellulose synthase operon protein YhjQ/BcsQ [Sphingobium sp.]
MTLVLMQSPKGGVGTSFLTAQLALHLAARGHDVSALDFTYQDALKLYLGFVPAQEVPDLADSTADALVASGVSLIQGFNVSRRSVFRQRLSRGLDIPFDQSRISIIDISAHDRELLDLLTPYCALHICTLMPDAGSLAVLHRVGGDAPVMSLEKTVFVLNKVDGRQRLSRHSQGFLRDLLGDQLIASVRRDEAVNEALARFESIAKYAPSSAILPDLVEFALAVEARLGLSSDTIGADAAATGGR